VLTHILNGFYTISGVFGVVLIIAVIHTVRQRGKERAEEPQKLVLGSGMILIGGLAGLLCAILLILYVWMVNIAAFDGVVTQKIRPTASKAGRPVPYHVLVEQKKRRIPRELYLRVEREDRLRHPFTMPYFYHNDQLIYDEQVLWSIGFYGGIALYAQVLFSAFVLRHVSLSAELG
jgi:hypothetical protein